MKIVVRVLKGLDEKEIFLGIRGNIEKKAIEILKNVDIGKWEKSEGNKLVFYCDDENTDNLKSLLQGICKGIVTNDINQEYEIYCLDPEDPYELNKYKENPRIMLEFVKRLYI